VDGVVRPVPRVAYERWLDSLVRAGWPAAGDRSTGGERVAVGEALGRVTAATVVARRPSPRTDCAAMDGIAVRAAELAAALAVPGAEGQPEDGKPDGQAVRLPAGLFEWIDTGDPMPAGTDTVIVRERLLPQADGSVVITPAAGGGRGGGRRTGHTARGRNVRTAGEDFGTGQALVPAGRRLRPGDLAAAAAGGHVTVSVARRPVVAIIPTGDEIRPVGTVPRFGDIIDTNSLMLTARCRQLGTEPVVSAVVPDDPDALAVELRLAAAQADLVLVIAGSSRGRGDHAAAVLAQVGRIAVAGVAVRPGHPALLGHAKRPAAGHGHPAEGHAVHRAAIAPVIGLPGYPLATAVIFELFAVPMLGALTGLATAPDRVRARLDRDWSSPADVEDWVLVTLAADHAGRVPVATPARRGAGSISQLARADAWWPIPAGQGTFTSGTQVEVIPLPGG
jgi:molybdopterin molybdotransferase/putative molybdopterin biosynthesis protein